MEQATRNKGPGSPFSKPLNNKYGIPDEINLTVVNGRISSQTLAFDRRDPT